MNQKAFTLVELAIVIVIIGLLVGGVLQGKELIDLAKVRSQIVQFRSFEAAHLTFKAKYNCLAGDCTNASTFFTSGAVNGDGDGELENETGTTGYDISPYPTWSASPEYGQFFVQLSKAGLIKGTYDGSRVIGQGLPRLEIKSGSAFFATSSNSFVTTGRVPVVSSYRTGKNAFFIVACNTSGTSMNAWDDSCGIFTPAQAYQIDSKLDDGNPLAGMYFSFGGTTTNNNCLITGNYDLSNNETFQCQGIYVFDK